MFDALYMGRDPTVPITPGILPSAPSLVRVRAGERALLALWLDGALHDLTAAADARLHDLDRLLELPRDEMQALLDDSGIESLAAVGSVEVELVAPVESEEVWVSGVTYLRSREARMEE